MAPLVTAPDRFNNKRKINHKEFAVLYLVKSLNILPVSEALHLLAMKLIADCYETKKSSDVIITDFLDGINNIRGAYVE